MQFGNDRQTMSQADARVAQYDVGLRKYMLGVYNYMAAAIALTGIVAMLASTSAPLMNLIHGTPLKWVVMLAPLGVVIFLSVRIHKMSAQTAQMTFWTYASLMGLSLSYILLAYTGVSVARTLFITAASFGALSLYGYTTKRDLSGMGTFLIMGLFGLIIASVVNWFLQSPIMHLVISAVGVLIVAGLTAYDTQKIKDTYNAMDGSEIAGKKAIMGALELYLDFILMFQFLLSFLGERE
ncbi:Bax inhibitor-1/YccA family protein [Terasakiella sp. A23]|uniref:Bax inhibitor-1/YccA family protein n=1 Tax=Terasakiella sp. FCG-A23 TaxID=3080561 RepID=UPI002952D07E|nr:Bax inhibitor-1/YccA family protein [Terasakiella sp. A23]MDV7340874.1 Bax inhibitor-1/YccA family protein [Terasakiella sp. A23]